jgi:shikimate kinase / 3-dehydroquinate synthase
MLPDRIVLVGPSGSGKSETASRLAQLSGYDVADTDSTIANRIDMSIAEFFERFGESAFRAIETEVLREACSRSRTIVATGGGAVLAGENWAIMRPNSVIVGLTAPPETLLSRVVAHSSLVGQSAVRPLLEGDRLARLNRMLADRAHLYAMADATIATDGANVDDVATTIVDICSERVVRGLVPRLALQSSTGRSNIYIGHGSRLAVAELIGRRWPGARRVWVVSDTHIDGMWGDEIEQRCASEGIAVSRLVVDPGEQSKDFAVVERLCRKMTDGGASRRDVVVALGGGVVGDLAGFAASICLRGLPVVQIPTSLLAMVDSSVGGKTGVNLPAGKNLAGTFYQPGVVLIDPTYLSTLPPEEYRSGMAEVIKHSIIQPSTPLGGRSLSELLASTSLDPIPDDVVVEALAVNVSIKHSVVKADERESGPRMMLNFGHTAGHAIEASGYRYRHGEAVAVGMVVAFRIAAYLGRVTMTQVTHIEELLASAGLPRRFEGDPDDVVARLARDKKNVDGSLHWVLPRSDGGVDIMTGIDAGIVRQAIQDVHHGAVPAADGAAVL